MRFRNPSHNKTKKIKLVQKKGFIKSRCVFPGGNYMFKVNNRNTKIRGEICLKLTTKTPE